MTTEPAQTETRDDQELAQALAGLTPDPKPATDGLSFEEAPTPSGAVTDSPFGQTPAADPVTTLPTPADPVTTDTASFTPPPATPAPDSPLESIKKDALNELRPLVDKLTVPPEEKFDTYLLLLRSTDDTTLIGPAHDAAKAIPDEARRAQALLDVIKEIDYLTTQK